MSEKKTVKIIDKIYNYILLIILIIYSVIVIILIDLFYDAQGQAYFLFLFEIIYLIGAISWTIRNALQFNDSNLKKFEINSIFSILLLFISIFIIYFMTIYVIVSMITAPQ